MTIQFITTNAGKFAEVSEKLAQANVKLVHLDRSYPEIQTDRLEKVLKYAATGLDDEVRGDYLIDDSGLFIEALGGFPGVYSAYVQKRLGNKGILKLMAGETFRVATFQTVFLLRRGDEHEVFHGDCTGTITDAERGKNGFGYDPIFLPQGETRTFGEMSLKEKNAISHRARAVDALLAHLSALKEP
ncbi:MAG TPA: XTP/dITP diphosphatase [Thermoplasmata archaeon]|nr:XTP/dITP diphosphatase [Thermoplasmata archaeon]